MCVRDGRESERCADGRAGLTGAHIDEAVGEGAGPGERVGDGLENGASRGLLVSLAHVLNVEALDGQCTLLLVEPAGRLRRGRDDEERDEAVSAGCEETRQRGGQAASGYEVEPSSALMIPSKTKMRCHVCSDGTSALRKPAAKSPPKAPERPGPSERKTPTRKASSERV